MGEPINRRAIGPFRIPGGNFGPQTNPFATIAMPGFITPEQPPAVIQEAPPFEITETRSLPRRFGPRSPLLL